MSRVTWERYAIQLASAATLRSEHPNPDERVGACVLRYDNSVAGVGYNGAPSKVKVDWFSSEHRRPRTIHAEPNALRYSRPHECRLLACTLMPCPNCLNEIAGYGITYVVYDKPYEKDASSIQLAQDYGIELVQIDAFERAVERFHKVDYLIQQSMADLRVQPDLGFSTLHHYAKERNL